MSINSLALIYDDALRADTTGGYCRRALEKLASPAHFRPDQISSLPPSFDGYLCIDDGLDYTFPSHLRPSIYWAIDTHLNFERSLRRAADFDLVFAAQKEGAARLRAEGLPNCEWLPLGCDPEIHQRREVEKEYDVAFIGHNFPGPRQEILEAVRARYDKVFIGTAPHTEMGNIYSRARIVINCCLNNDLNMRVFEALSCGALLITNHLNNNGQEDLFQDRIHLVEYRTPAEALELIDYYLSHPEEREQIAAAGHQEAISHHTYRHRMEQLLTRLERYLEENPNSPATRIFSSGEIASTSSDTSELPADSAYLSETAALPPSEESSSAEPPEAEAAPSDAPRPSLPAPQSSPSPEEHDAQYFHWARPDLLALVPLTAKRILDVGCAAGLLGESIKQRQECEVVGIELHPGAAAEASTRLDKVIQADVETLDFDFVKAKSTPSDCKESRGCQSCIADPPSEAPESPALFDAIICGDIIEHLREPAALLQKLRALLSPAGVLIASFPNIRHIDIVQKLVEGNWTYEPAGLLDRDHLRFFTRRSAEQLLEECGFTVDAPRAVPSQGYAEWEQAGRPGELRAGRLGITGLSADEAREFFIGQWLLVARPAPAASPGLTSIIILTWNQLSYTRLCLESIRKHTPQPYELIFVDNGSTDGSADWLRQQPDIKLITNAENLGFAKGVNQGLEIAQGENLLLLNNDTVVTPGWLPRLLEGLHSSAEIGMAGPVTNFVSGPQQISVPYQTLSGLDGFAWDWSRAHRGQTIPYDRLVGFCLLIKRSVLGKIGYLDERFGLGNFEDDDLCLRALQAGYKLLICRDAFIHHFGGRTFVGNKVPSGELLQENSRRFAEKWNLPAIAPATRPAPPKSPPPATSFRRAEKSAPSTFKKRGLPRHASGGLLLKKTGASSGAPRISLCMIARDEEPRIAHCLNSIRPYVDEMILVDTGSKDRTPEIARELGAKVTEIPWPDSFSAARNASIDQATGDWIFWMDADDVIDEASGLALRECAEQADPTVFGFVAQVHCPAGPGEEGETVVDHVKLFRNRPDLRFELRMHEQILPSLRRAGGEIARAPIHITHAHYDHTPAGQKKKRTRDSYLLALDLQENPDHPFVHFNIGMTAFHEKDHPKAVHHLRRSIDLSAPQDSQVRKAYALLASSYRAMNNGAEALNACREGRGHYPDDAELLFNEALAWQLSGDLRQAERVSLELLGQTRQPDYLASLDVGIYSYKARHNLGAIYEQMGESAKAEACWRQVISEEKKFLPSWLALGELLINDGKTEALEQLAREAAAQDEIIAAMLRGRNALRGKEYFEAEKHFREIVKQSPHLDEGYRFLSQALLQRGERREVEGVLRRLLDLAPEDAEGHYNLATLLLEQERTSEAVILYQQALQLRPNYEQARHMLQEAMRKMNSPKPSTSFTAETPSTPRFAETNSL